MLQKTEPITARASAAGRGGIGIVRLSGQTSDVLGIAKTMLPTLTLHPRHAHLSSLTESSGEFIDQAIVLYFPAPHSYTGESVLEFQSHGGQVVNERIIHRILEAGEPYGVRIGSCCCSFLTRCVFSKDKKAQRRVIVLKNIC